MYYSNDSAQNITKLGPRSLEDFLAGSSLLIYGITGLLIYGFFSIVLFKLALTLNGFIILFSEAVSNLLLIFQFGLYNGFLILLQNNPLPQSSHLVVAVICDFFWFAMAQHYPLIACSRLAAIKWPIWFKFFESKKIVFICLFFWCFALLQSIGLRFTSWYVMFYFDPENYGMTTDDWEASRRGTEYFWDAYHGLMIFGPLAIYGATIAILFQQRGAVRPAENQSSSMSVEKRLLIPCAINSVIYLVGKIVFNLSNNGGKWGTWLYSLVFLTNSFVNPFLLVGFSSVVREKAKELVGGKKNPMISNNLASQRKPSARSAATSPTPK